MTVTLYFFLYDTFFAMGKSKVPGTIPIVPLLYVRLFYHDAGRLLLPQEME